MAHAGSTLGMNKVDRARVLQSLREVLLELAASTVKTNKGGTPTALDLVNQFECVARLAGELMPEPLTDAQHHSLGSMQEYIDFMHTLAPRVWSDTAIDDHACWQQLKEMAKRALEAFGWTLPKPE